MKSIKYLAFSLCLILAILFEVLFVKYGFGISFPIWILAFLLVLLILAGVQKHKLPWYHWLLLLVSLVFAIFAGVRSEPLTRMYSAMASLALLWLAGVAVLKANWLKFGLLDYITHGAYQIGGSLFGLMRAIVRPKSSQVVSDETTQKYQQQHRKTWLSILVGLLVALPVLVVLLSLLVAADSIFSAQLSGLFGWLLGGDWSKLISPVIRVLLLSLVLFGLALYTFLPEKEFAVIPAQSTKARPLFGWIEGVVVLSLVNILFLLFVIVQVRYLFGGEVNIHVDGLTYAEYARQGFMELVMVSIISLGLYAFVANITRFEKPWQRAIHTGLNTLLIILVGVILFSAYQRLQLYIGTYGLSSLRAYTRLFIYCLALLLAGTVAMEFLRLQKYYPALFIAFAMLFGLVMGFSNVDATIVRHNIQHSLNNKEFDRQFIGQLSADAVPELFQQWNTLQEQALKDQVGAELSCRTAALYDASQKPWYSLTLSEHRANQMLGQNAQALSEQYPRRGEKFDTEVKIGGSWQYCRVFNEWMD